MFILRNRLTISTVFLLIKKKYNNEFKTFEKKRKRVDTST